MNVYMSICYNVIVLIGLIIVGLLLMMDTASFALCYILQPQCITISFCLNTWLLWSSVGSTFFNFLRLGDLAHLFVAMDQVVNVSVPHLICRVTFELVITIFHLISGTLGIFFIFMIENDHDHNSLVMIIADSTVLSW